MPSASKRGARSNGTGAATRTTQAASSRTGRVGVGAGAGDGAGVGVGGVGVQVDTKGSEQPAVPAFIKGISLTNLFAVASSVQQGKPLTSEQAALIRSLTAKNGQKPLAARLNELADGAIHSDEVTGDVSDAADGVVTGAGDVHGDGNMDVDQLDFDLNALLGDTPHPADGDTSSSFFSILPDDAHAEGFSPGFSTWPVQPTSDTTWDSILTTLPAPPTSIAPSALHSSSLAAPSPPIDIASLDVLAPSPTTTPLGPHSGTLIRAQPTSGALLRSSGPGQVLQTSASIQAIPKNVPQFLVKLYNLVNDPANSQYIYWSPDGTSFFVELPDSFATTVLPRFFKHSNYSSFVRQLNMYGFRKVPHVQAGALRPDDPDLDQIAEFEHPYFQRGMVDMLQYVSRSKRADRAREEHTAAAAAAAAAATVPNATSAGSSASAAAQNASGSARPPPIPPATPQLPLTSLATDLAQLKRLAFTLSTDLAALRAGQDRMRAELLRVGERGERQRRVVESIVGFLRGLVASGGVVNGEGQGRQKRRRLLLEGGPASGGQSGGRLEEVLDEDVAEGGSSTHEGGDVGRGTKRKRNDGVLGGDHDASSDSSEDEGHAPIPTLPSLPSSPAMPAFTLDGINLPMDVPALHLDADLLQPTEPAPAVTRDGGGMSPGMGFATATGGEDGVLTVATPRGRVKVPEEIVGAIDYIVQTRLANLLATMAPPAPAAPTSSGGRPVYRMPPPPSVPTEDTPGVPSTDLLPLPVNRSPSGRGVQLLPQNTADLTALLASLGVQMDDPQQLQSLAEQLAVQEGHLDDVETATKALQEVVHAVGPEHETELPKPDPARAASVPPSPTGGSFDISSFLNDFEGETDGAQDGAMDGVEGWGI